MESLTVNVLPNTVHTVYIVAVGEGGESEPSHSYTFTVPGPILSYTMNVPYNTFHTVYITAVGEGGESAPSQVYTFRVPSRLLPVPPPPQQKITPCPIQLPNSAKQPIPTFNRREFWSWGASRVGKNCNPINQ